jgi:hypothetical protein
MVSFHFVVLNEAVKFDFTFFFVLVPFPFDAATAFLTGLSQFCLRNWIWLAEFLRTTI